VLRIEGQLERLPTDSLTGPAIRELVLPVLDRRRRRDLNARRFTDFAFDVPGVGRFRANVHFERGRLGACFRALPATVPRLDQLGLPAALTRIPDLGAGLVLVVGPSGSGKTTTLAALLQEVMTSRAVHAITVEEPVEYVHEHQGSIVEQVEIPLDCPTFADAIRSALRQSPDVLLVGEMRDGETMAAALTAAETGHLVLASVHAYTAPQAIHRVMDAFPSTQQEQVRRQLAATLAAIVAQRLLPAADGRRRVAAAEVLFANDAVRNVVREGRIHNLGQVITGAGGMVSLEASLADAVRSGRLDRATAERFCYHPDELKLLLR